MRNLNLNLKSIESKILNWELKLRYVIKNLTFGLKIIVLTLLLVFIVSALIILKKVDSNLSVEAPERGGVLREGIIGTPRFINPVLTISDADRDLSMLVYSGLMRADNNNIIPDLAEGYTVDEDGLCYSFKLKSDIFWSDNEPITSDDVVFTIKQIKNPLTKSPKRASWEGIEVEKVDNKTVDFCLERPYAPFLENTTVGILPYHIWKDMIPEQMPLSNFNIQPIGSGPYKIEKISRNSSGIITSYTLTINKNFVLQKPYIEKIILKFYPSEKKMIEAYKEGAIESLGAISPQSMTEIRNDKSKLKTYLLPRVFAVFFNQDQMPLFAENGIREALNLATNKRLIVNDVLENFGTTINGPIPPGSLGSITESETELNFEEQKERARELLKKNGWILNEEENVLERETKKGTEKLEFSLSTSNVSDLIQTAEMLQNMWQEIGVVVHLKIYEIGDLEQNVIRPRKYDAILFGEIMGRDPDAFAFWHSSQRNDPGLNIALYTNITADKLLEEARVTLDKEERKNKYREFQQEIIDDTPAVFLYSPYFIYLAPLSLKGQNQDSITISSERFSQIYNWHLRTKDIWKIFQ